MYLVSSTALPKSNAITLDDPQLATGASAVQRGRNPSHVCDYGSFVLPFEPQNDDARMLVRRVPLNISEVQIKSHENATFVSCPGRDCLVFGT